MNTIKKWKYLINQYELTKAKKHHSYRFVNDFYKAHGLSRQNFIKYYNRFKNTHDTKALLPQKRGPRFHHKRTLTFIENKVIKLRTNGLNRYEIFANLKPKLKKYTPAPSTVYQIFKRHKLNRLKPKMKQEKRRIIKEKAGELGHVDCHYLPKGIIEGDNKRYYFLGVIDSCTRVAWTELVPDIKSLTVMFATLKSLNIINSRYNIQFKELLTDNGPEFGGRKDLKKETNPFARLLVEMGIKQRHTRPYRPQTNGKIERFWRTIQDDLLEGMVFDSKQHLIDELQHFMLYYNEDRPHQALNGKNPDEFNKSRHRNT